VNAKKRGVAIRIIMDPRANDQYPTNAGALNDWRRPASPCGSASPATSATGS
jgi:hypothetical protein